jgi:hypothetical protein
LFIVLVEVNNVGFELADFVEHSYSKVFVLMPELGVSLAVDKELLLALDGY